LFIYANDLFVEAIALDHASAMRPVASAYQKRLGRVEDAG